MHVSLACPRCFAWMHTMQCRQRGFSAMYCMHVQGSARSLQHQVFKDGKEEGKSRHTLDRF